MKYLNINQIIFFGLIIRILNTLWNSLINNSIGADVDAVNFDNIARTVAISGVMDEFTIGYIPYTNILGLIYRYTINHVLIGGFLSCLAWLLSALLLANYFKVLHSDITNKKLALLIYAILPSSVMLTSVTLRESYQLLFLVLSIFAFSKIYFNIKSKHWITLLFSICLHGILHGALLTFGMIQIFLFLSFFIILKFNKESVILFYLISMVFLFFFMFYFCNIFYEVNDIIFIFNDYHVNGLLNVGRTNYKTTELPTDLWGLFIYITLSFYNYMMKPMPWDLFSGGDIFVFIENLLRIWLIFYFINSFIKIRNNNRSLRIIVFICYLALEFIWSLGTLSWGTAIRHHLPSMGLLIMSVFAFSSNKLSKK
jgi:hypothetical protein